MPPMRDKGPRIKKIPPGDSRERLVCPECDFVEYHNPKVVNVVVPVFREADGTEKFLLCRRAIDPSKGYWTLPGGYMETGESLQGGAARETAEEAGAAINVGALLAIFQPPSKHEIIMIFRGEMTAPTINPGPESFEAKLFKWEDIPWNELAFPFVKDALLAYQQTKNLQDFQPAMIEGVKYTPPPPRSSIANKRPRPRGPGM
jgi:ADP-ribose pyrophosphatase YjhB (NUDIX family)